MNLAIVVSKFNEEVTSGLLRGARQYLNEKQIHIPESDVYEAPGAFEVPLIAQTLARSTITRDTPASCQWPVLLPTRP